MSVAYQLRTAVAEPIRTGPSTFVYHPCPRRAAYQRIGDVVVASLALIVALPLLVIGALLVRLEDGGPVLFRQRRIGQYGAPFTIYKLRTMRVSSCTDLLKPSCGGDPRITRVGRILRKTSIDELPQLFNVLRGDMGIVGPRPEMPFIVAGYEPWQHLRHLVKPGITGLWQTTCRSSVPLHTAEATLIDLDYISQASPQVDATIIAGTFRALVSARGAV